MKGFINANVYVEGKGIVKTNLGIENGLITYIGDDESKITETLPYKEGQVVLPGFIDEHIHGAAGADAMDKSVDALATIATAIAKEGTTAFLATTMTQSEENITDALTAVKEYISDNHSNGAKLLGVHLEGPFISELHIGAQPLEHVKTPSVSTFKKYFAASGNSIKIVSLAPEETNAIELIKELKSLGVVASAGHSDAGEKHISAAMEAGLSTITHTYNAQRGLHHREIGVVGSALLYDELYAEAICDLIHLSVPAIKLLLKNKPKDKFVLITDSMRAKHLSDGISELGGQKVIVKNGEARLENGALAGSILKMNDAIKNLVNVCGVSITDAVDFASANPAKNLKIFDEQGSIAIGKKANFAVLDNEFNVTLTVREGNIIYRP